MPTQPTTNNLEGKRETINHLATVLMCMFGEIERLKDNSLEKETEKQWNKRNDKTHKLYNEARKYLEDYITDLREHDMEELIKMLPEYSPFRDLPSSIVNQCIDNFKKSIKNYYQK